MEGKLIIFAAPSGSGKSTIINSIMADGGAEELNLHFSISATSRAPRGEEKNGVEYFFLTPEEFRQKIANNEFIEYEEVYKDKFYGTLKSQVDKQLAEGENVVFDVDVNGAMNIKKLYGKRALSIFIQPPSIEELRRRLEKRATDAPEVIAQRVERAKYELEQAEHFDEVVINDNLEIAQVEARALVEGFLEE
jgi:guanylate kinase